MIYSHAMKAASVRHRLPVAGLAVAVILALAAVVLGVASIILTLDVLHDFTAVAASVGFDGASKPWKNLGVGGWMMCVTFTLLAGAGWIAATHKRADDVIAAESGGALAPEEDPVPLAPAEPAAEEPAAAPAIELALGTEDADPAAP